ncbi:fructose-2,6-bisphosphatase TIGAR B-like [Glandiceps talaboti]
MSTHQMLFVTLVRHGETVANKTRTVQGQADGCLTKLGELQAQRLGKRLADTQFDAIICSDLLRTRQTAACVMKFRPFQNVYLEPLLRERAAGVLEGRPYGTHEKLAKAAGISSRKYSPEGGESWEDVKSRAKQFGEKLVDTFLVKDVAVSNDSQGTGEGDQASKGKGSKTNILVVSHGGFIKEFVNQWCKVPRMYPNSARNTAVYQFYVKFRPGSPLPFVDMVAENDITHLEGWKCTDPDQEEACTVSLENLNIDNISWTDMFAGYRKLPAGKM